MADELISDFPVLSDAQMDDNTKLVAAGVAATGVLSSGTIGQQKLVFHTKKTKYTTTGAEGTTITIAALAGRDVLAVFREGMLMYEVISPAVPDPAEFTWDTVNINLGLTVNPAGGERFLILYKNL